MITIQLSHRNSIFDQEPGRRLNTYSAYMMNILTQVITFENSDLIPQTHDAMLAHPSFPRDYIYRWDN